MAPVPANSIWAQMNYVPPRGSCNHKSSVFTGTCPCLRFMLHPVKSASSFECDGCNHHASFHNLENGSEEETLRKWREREFVGDAATAGASPPQSKKRKLPAIEGAASSGPAWPLGFQNVVAASGGLFGGSHESPGSQPVRGGGGRRGGRGGNHGSSAVVVKLPQFGSRS